MRKLWYNTSYGWWVICAVKVNTTKTSPNVGRRRPSLVKIFYRQLSCFTSDRLCYVAALCVWTVWLCLGVPTETNSISSFAAYKVTTDTALCEINIIQKTLTTWTTRRNSLKEVNGPPLSLKRTFSGNVPSAPTKITRRPSSVWCAGSVRGPPPGSPG